MAASAVFAAFSYASFASLQAAKSSAVFCSRTDSSTVMRFFSAFLKIPRLFS
jgi:hypothetical protein